MVAREVNGKKVVLPIWHEIDAEWAATGFKDTLLRCMKSEVVHGYKTAIQPGIQD